MFDSPDELLLGLATGVAFGILLQKGRVAKFPVIVGQFLLRDWTVAKIMGTAVVVGSAGVFALAAAGRADLHVKPLQLGGVLLGGLLFGVGMTVLGYCPGTTVAACGEGRRDAVAGVLGMFAGALAFVAAWPALQPVIKGLGDGGKVTLPDLTGTSPWVWVGALAAAGLVAAVLLYGRGKPATGSTPTSDPGVRAGSPA
jgi:uncharacterized membrane protein YedE/YeeE